MPKHAPADDWLFLDILGVETSSGADDEAPANCLRPSPATESRDPRAEDVRESPRGAADRLDGRGRRTPWLCAVPCGLDSTPAVRVLTFPLFLAPDDAQFAYRLYVLRSVVTPSTFRVDVDLDRRSKSELSPS